MTLFDLFEACQNVRLNSNVYIYNGASNMEKALDEYGTQEINYFHLKNDRDIEVYFK